MHPTCCSRMACSGRVPGATRRAGLQVSLEGFWSLTKRGISVYHAVSAEYLPTYLNEYAFRYNRRDQEKPMFEFFLAQIVRTEGGPRNLA